MKLILDVHLFSTDERRIEEDKPSEPNSQFCSIYQVSLFVRLFNPALLFIFRDYLIISYYFLCSYAIKMFEFVWDFGSVIFCFGAHF